MAFYSRVLLLGLLLVTSTVHSTTLVEVVLVDKLEEPRGFCLDIVGSRQKATPARGLQVHTCYGYQGKIAVDQGFDGDGLKNGEFRLPWFKVCMTTAAAQSGSTLALRDCDGTTQQRFHFTSAGQIIPDHDSSLCLTVSDAPSSRGAGGNPPHLIRRLAYQPCDGRLDKYQKWHIREKAD
jgi:hypothetical protein